MLYALIVDGAVTEERTYPAALSPELIKAGPDGLPMVRPLEIEEPALARCQSYSGFAYVIEPARVRKVFEPGPVDLVALRDLRVSEVAAQQEAARTAGFEWPALSGVRYRFRAKDLADIGGNVSRALAVLAGGVAVWPAGFQWIDSENGRPPIATAEEMVALGLAALDAQEAVVMHGRDLKDAIEAAETAEAIEAVDISLGW